MFGFFRPKAERLALRIERLYMSAEMAFDRGKHDTARLAVHQMLPTLKALHYEGWSESQLNDFLRERGLCRSFIDKEYEGRFRGMLNTWASY